MNNNPIVLAILIVGALAFAVLPTICNVPLLDFITGVALFLVMYIVFTCGNHIKPNDNILANKSVWSWKGFWASMPWYEILVYLVAIMFVILVVNANGSNPSH